MLKLSFASIEAEDLIVYTCSDIPMEYADYVLEVFTDALCQFNDKYDREIELSQIIDIRAQMFSIYLVLDDREDKDFFNIQEILADIEC